MSQVQVVTRVSSLGLASSSPTHSSTGKVGRPDLTLPLGVW